MSVNRRPKPCAVPIAVAAATVFLAVLAASFVVHAQANPFQGQMCTAPPSPETDTWPVAATDSLGATVSVTPVTFTGAALLANDRGTALRVNAVALASANGGRITGTDPYTYT